MKHLVTLFGLLIPTLLFAVVPRPQQFYFWATAQDDLGRQSDLSNRLQYDPPTNHPPASITLAWDASPSPGVTNYVIYGSTNPVLSLTNLLLMLDAGTNLMLNVQLWPKEPLNLRVNIQNSSGMKGPWGDVTNLTVEVEPTDPQKFYRAYLEWQIKTNALWQTNAAAPDLIVYPPDDPSQLEEYERRKRLLLQELEGYERIKKMVLQELSEPFYGAEFEKGKRP